MKDDLRLKILMEETIEVIDEEKYIKTAINNLFSLMMQKAKHYVPITVIFSNLFLLMLIETRIGLLLRLQLLIVRFTYGMEKREKLNTL